MLRSPHSWRRLARSAKHPLAVNTTAALATAWACLLLGTSCSKSPKDRVVDLLGERCTLNSDCKKKDYVCAFGRCHEECLATRDCPRPGRCVRSEHSDVHVCQLEQEVACTISKKCQGDQVCAGDGSCRDECEEDKDCLKEQVCSEEAGVCADEWEQAIPVGPPLAAGGSSASRGTAGANNGQGGRPNEPASGGEGGAGNDGNTGGAAGRASGELLISPDGGTYDEEGVTLVVPAGAVSSPTRVTVQVVADPRVSIPDGWWPRGDIYQLAPRRLEFDEDVEIWVPHDEKDTETLLVAWLSADGTEWQKLSADFTGHPGYGVVDQAALGWYTVVSTFDCQQCSDTQTCQNNHCYDPCDVQTCSGGLECCQVDGEAICVDTDTDPDHCGGCGVPCKSANNTAELACSRGVCVLESCVEPYLDCDGNPDNGCEADPTSDAQHCGGCAQSCGAGSECNKGVCDEGLSEIAAGYAATCLRRENGAVVCWGSLEGGAAQPRPQVVPGVRDVATIDVALHVPSRAYAVVDTGQLLSWGASAAEWETPTVEAITGVTDFEGGASFRCVLRSGQASCWGVNNYGQLGNTDVAKNETANTPVSVTGLSDARQIAVGVCHACARRKGGQVVCWGYNGYGQLGNETNVDANKPEPVVGPEDFVDITVGQYHSCGVRTGGEVLCWGQNSSGQLGGSDGNSDLPVAVSGLEDVASVHAGLTHTCALHTDGTVSCWGGNKNGQLGNGTTTQPKSPEAAPVPDLTKVVMLTAGANHNCVLRASGPPLCWGQNSSGQLGDSSYDTQSSPKAVVDLP